MAKVQFKNGQTSVILRVFLQDTSSTTGAGKTGLTSASAGLIISTIADNEATATTYTQAGSTIETITTLGTFAAPTATKCRFKEIDATNFPGAYEIQIADARWAVSSAKSLLVSILGATGIPPTFAEVQLSAVDPNDAVRGGMTALPNVASGSAGAIITSGTGTAQLSVTAGAVNTLTTYTGDTPQSGDSFARLGVAGVGLTNLGDARIANLDATVSSRLATAGYTAPLSAVSTRAAVGMASANLDTQLAAIDADVLTRLSTGGYTAPDNASVAAILGQTGTTGVVVAAASKTGYALSAAGLDTIGVTDPGVPSTHTTLPKMMVAIWRRFFKKSTMTATELATYADDGSTKRGKAVLSDDLTTQTVGAAADGP